MREKSRLPESELDIMLAVWGSEGPATAPHILERLERPIGPSALHSYLKRLEEKGYLSCAKSSKVNCYTPLVSREEYREREGRTVLQKLYDNSLKRFAAALYDGGELAPADLEELRTYLDELERGSARHV